MSATFHLRYFFEFGAGPLWSTNEAAVAKYGHYVSPEALPLTAETQSECERLDQLYSESMNQKYPPDPSLWRQVECDRFNEAALALYNKVVCELGPDFLIVNEQPVIIEDPDLDKYLRNPAAFKRKA
jgi:hypothetical protein